jgi:hypothetical protein
MLLLCFQKHGVQLVEARASNSTRAGYRAQTYALAFFTVVPRFLLRFARYECNSPSADIFNCLAWLFPIL